ncbi:MAG: IS1182 family transposase [Acidobacteria bacterium]|nr:IS1182 family transposase [Acidobacteriota bacterium]MBX3290970.1 IS1182 family transposase [Acidobacteriota bacterium]
MGYIGGVERGQGMMFPATLDEYVRGENPVRVIGAFVENLPIREMGFVRGEPAETGRPGYDPRMMLAVYIWGHLNGVRSSRRLERECGRNVELMWLSGLLQPDFKTLSRFRKDNSEGINNALVKFRVWCEEAGLFGKDLVAIDGSKFKAVNSKSRALTQEQLTKLIEREKAEVDKYLAELEEADNADEGEERKLTAEEIKEKIRGLEEHLKKHEEAREGLAESGENRVSLTDPESRMMKTSKGSDVSYNIQTSVDSKHDLILDVEVTNDVSDQGLLAKMAMRAKEILGVGELKVTADGGYFDGDEIKACEEEDIETYVSIPESKAAESKGIFPLTQFEYNKEKDVYACPAGAQMKRTGKPVKNGRANSKEYYRYTTKACSGCPLRAQCTTSKYGRTVKRWVHQEVVDRLRERMAEKPEIIKKRKAIVEHPFGTIKVGMGHERLLMKGIKGVGTEIRLTVLTYNIKRVMSIFGIPAMIEKLNGQNRLTQNAYA